MKKQITLSTLLLSLLMLVLLGCGDNSTNSPKVKYEVGPFAGTTWKCIAYVDENNNVIKTPHNEPIDDEYMKSVYFNLFFLDKISRIDSVGIEPIPITIIGFGYDGYLIEGTYQVIPNTNKFKELFIDHYRSLVAVSKTIKWMEYINNCKSFYKNNDTLKLYQKDDGTGKHLLFIRDNKVIDPETLEISVKS